MSDDRLEQLLLNLNHDSQAIRIDAIKDLGHAQYRGNQDVIDGLVASLRHPDAGDAMAYRVRQAAAQSLGIVGDKSALQPLIYALSDHSSGVKVSAVNSLGQIGDPYAVEALTEMLTDENGEVRYSAVLALGVIGADHAIDLKPLISLLADPEDNVRDATERIVLDLGKKHAFDTVLDALHDPNSTIRGAIAEILGDIGDDRAWERLYERMQDDDSQWVRSRAEVALDKLPKPEAFKRTLIEQDDEPVLPQPPIDTLKLVRDQKPELPTLAKLRGETEQSVEPTQPDSQESQDPSVMTVEQIQNMIDQLDVRLANGEISEATYTKLVERWEKRL